ncbi:hypothetical protein MLD38_036977 [Melastoma candidum]|uniref:Uncharacterized protein n=1 Tax=Melastoma candidum TaxID=119954 RepID=A0ACB9LLE3_9MYRT|nr:hypothetical protein MLD38_036977 [Melastoma candidum]
MEEAGDPPPSASRRKSSRKRSRPAEGKDLISALPDALILHVFFFLDVKDVVKTSVLSKRWSSLWTQTSAISIDSHCSTVRI